MITEVNVAIDLGNGFIKAKSPLAEFIIPSSLVLCDETGLNVFASGLGKDFDLYDINGVSFVTGNKIEIVDAKDLKESYTSNSNRYNLKVYQLLFISTIAKLVEKFTPSEAEILQVNVITSLPSSDINSANKQKLMDFLFNKTHNVKINQTKEVEFQINDLKVIPQPLGTLLDLAIDQTKGLDPETLQSNYIVIDFGAGSTIIDTFNRLNRIPEKSKTVHLGMKDIYKKILDNHPDQGFLNVSDIEKVLKNGQDLKIGKNYILEYAPVYEAFRKYAQQFVDFEIQQDINEIVNNNKRVEVIITGGGSILMKDLFDVGDVYYTFVKKPQLAAINGMYKLINLEKAKSKIEINIF